MGCSQWQAQKQPFIFHLRADEPEMDESVEEQADDIAAVTCHVLGAATATGGQEEPCQSSEMVSNLRTGPANTN